jgi:hypothetical protein
MDWNQTTQRLELCRLDGGGAAATWDGGYLHSYFNRGDFCTYLPCTHPCVVRNTDTSAVIGIVSIVKYSRDRRGGLSTYLPCCHLHVVRITDTGDAIVIVSVVGWRMTHFVSVAGGA